MGLKNYWKGVVVAGAVAFYVTFIGNTDATLGLIVWSFMTMNVVVSLKTRERQEDWLQFYIAGNLDVQRISLVMPILVVVVVVAASLLAIVAGSLARLGWGADPGAGIGTILAVANAAWFYGNLQILVMQIVPLDKVMGVMRLSVIVIVICAKLLAGEDAAFLDTTLVFSLLLIANLLLTIPASSCAYRRSYRLAGAARLNTPKG